MNYQEIYAAIRTYTENDEAQFLANIPVFVREAETRIYNTVHIPSLRRNVTGVTTGGTPYLTLPADWLAPYSLAVIDSDGTYHYLLDKDVNFIREAYPSPADSARPQYYALFGTTLNNSAQLSLLLGPTPDATYTVEMHYFYYPESIVQAPVQSLSVLNAGSGYVDGQYFTVPLTGGTGTGATADITVTAGAVTSVRLSAGGSFYAVGDTLTASFGGSGSNFAVQVIKVGNPRGTSWLGDHFDPVLFYGAMREAMLFMKQEQDLVKYYEDKYKEALEELVRLCAGLERGDAYRDGQPKIKSPI